MPAVVEVAMVGSGEDLWAVARVQNTAYGERVETGRHDVDRLRRTVDGGGAVALARWDGVPAGTGLFTSPRHGLVEIAAVGVLPAYRRRGIASAVTAALTSAAFAAGATPYLQTETANERRLYARLGYHTVGELIAISR